MITSTFGRVMWSRATGQVSAQGQGFGIGSPAMARAQARWSKSCASLAFA